MSEEVQAVAKPGPAPAGPQKHEFKVAMNCGGCEKAVRAVLSKTPGVEGVTVDLATQKVCVSGTAPKDVLLERIGKTGKKTEYVGLCQ